MQKLPPEIFLQIMGYLETKDLTALSSTSKEWDWLRAYIKEFVIFRELEKSSNDLTTYLRGMKNNINNGLLSPNFKIFHNYFIFNNYYYGARYQAVPSLLEQSLILRICNAFHIYYNDEDEKLANRNDLFLEHINIIDFVIEKLEVEGALQLLSLPFLFLLKGIFDFWKETENCFNQSLSEVQDRNQIPLLEKENEAYMNASHKAAFNLIQKFIAKGVNLNSEEFQTKHYPPLHLLGENFYLDHDGEIGVLLVENGANPEAVDHRNHTVFDNIQEVAEDLESTDIEIAGKFYCRMLKEAHSKTFFKHRVEETNKRKWTTCVDESQGKEEPVQSNKKHKSM